MKRLFILCLFVHISYLLLAQSFKIPSIQVSDLDGESPVEIQKINFDIKVVGTKVITEVDMTFYNPNSRTLEGELQFPLTAGQTICGFSLDINGKLRESVAIEKDKGREAFESITRGNVDPGLLEMTADNNFKLRIYPILAKRTRRAVISYEHELTSNENYTYKLPLSYNTSLKELSLKITAYGQSIAPSAKYSNNTKLEFTKKNDKYELSEKLNNNLPDEFIFQLNKPQEKQLFVEQGRYSRDFKFYSISKPKYAEVEQRMPQSIAIYWDASLSMQERDFEKEVEFLKQYLKTTENIKVQLYSFGLTISQPQTFDISNGNIDKIKDVLKNTVYDGATRYDQLELTKTDCEQILFFSDGLASMGDKNTLPKSNTPVITINSKQSCNHFILQNTAAISGGKYIDLSKQSTNNAIQSLQYKSFRFISAEYDKKEIKDLYPSQSQEINIGESFKLTGTLEKRSARIKLNFGIDNTILYSETLDIHASESNNYNNFVERYWANTLLNELYRNFEKNKEKITEIGKKYQMITRTTSLIVLETLEDYVLYDIVPPEELQEDFYKLKTKLEAEKQKEKEENEDDENDDDDDNYKEPKETEAKLKKHYKMWKASANPDKLALWIKNQEKKRKEEEEREERKEIRKEKRENRQYERESKQRNREYKRRNKQYGYTSSSSYYSNNVQSSYKQKGITLSKDASRLITGHITDQNTGEDLFASIMVKGTTTGTVTDINGYYSINVPAGIGELEYSFIGYKSITVPIQSSIIDVQLVEEESRLLESVVIAYSTTSSGDGYSPPSPTASEQIAGGASARPTEMASSISEALIRLTDWSPNAPYVDSLNNAKPDNIYDLYLKLKSDYYNMPSFYLDAATILNEKGLKNESYKVLSNIAELDFENPKLLRVLAHKLSYWGYLKEAIEVYDEILILRPEEPQSYRDLALAYANDKQYQKAIDIFEPAIFKKYDERFTDISTIMLGEMGNIIATAKREGIKVKTKNITRDLLKNMDTDIRIVLSWDTDNTDMDLYITDPKGIKSFYNHRVAKSGGLMSADFLGGYGPEEFILRNAVKGTYKIKVNYFSSQEQMLTGPATIFLDIYTNYGRPNVTKETISIRLGKDTSKKVGWLFHFK